MSRRDDIIHAQTTALKEKNQLELSTIRMLFAAVKNADIEKGSPVGDEEIEQIVTKQVKQLKDAEQEFTKGGRADLVEQTKKELEILSRFLPPQLSPEEIKAIATSVIATMQPVVPKEIGKVLGAVMKEVRGRADGGTVRSIVTELVS